MANPLEDVLSTYWSVWRYIAWSANHLEGQLVSTALSAALSLSDCSDFHHGGHLIAVWANRATCSKEAIGNCSLISVSMSFMYQPPVCQRTP